MAIGFLVLDVMIDNLACRGETEVRGKKEAEGFVVGGSGQDWAGEEVLMARKLGHAILDDRRLLLPPMTGHVFSSEAASEIFCESQASG